MIQKMFHGLKTTEKASSRSYLNERVLEQPQFIDVSS